MSPPARTPVLLAVIVLQLTRCAFAATCSSTFVSLPSAILGANVYLTTVDSADAICKHKGFSKAGSVRTSTLSAVGLSMPAIRVRNLGLLGRVLGEPRFSFSGTFSSLLPTLVTCIRRMMNRNTNKAC
ncbi:hypothetical protein ACKKBG_A11650 [Auxenochlorella protothecoides x Auxenochlorella symbiontica]